MRPSTTETELGLVTCLWQRELLRFLRERSRWAAAIAQPLVFWLILGTGMAESFRVPGPGAASALQYFYPGMLAMIVLFATVFTTMSLIEDRQQGFLQAVLVAPGSRTALVAGKVLGVVSLTLVQCAALLVLAPLAGFRLGDVSWGLLLATAALASTGLAAANFAVAWWLDSVQAYHAVMGVVFVPLWFLSGALFPRPDSWLGSLMSWNPLTHAVDGLRCALSPDCLGAPGPGVAVNLAVLGAFALAGLGAAAWACRRPAAPPARPGGRVAGLS